MSQHEEDKKPEATRMVDRIAARLTGDSWGYFGPCTGRNPALDGGLDEALTALQVAEAEAEGFLASRAGRHLADALHGLEPGKSRTEIERQVKQHLAWYRGWQNRKGSL